MCKNEGIKPPDGGYGWIIVVSSIIINSCLLPLTQCFGIIYQSQFHQMDISAAQISFLLHLNNFVMCCLGLISGPLLKRFNFQQVAFIGGGLVCLGIFSTTFARTYNTLIITIGIIIGAGNGILMPGTYIAVNSYFKERLTLAISLQVTGASLSQIFMPQVCNYLIECFGVQGTVLILSGLSLNAIPAIMLMRPIKKPKPPKVEVELVTSDKQHVSERLLSPIYQETTYPVKNKENRCKEIIKSLDLELFGDRVYVIIVIGMSISFVAELNIVLMTPFILDKLAGFPQKSIANAMSVQATADIVGRLIIPIFAHRAKAPPKIMYMTSLVGSSLGRTLLAFFYDNSGMVYLVSAIVGLFKGVKAVFQSVIIPKFVSKDKLAAATGLYMVTNGILSVIIGPLIGWTHDLGNSYVYTLHTASILSMFCVFLWIGEYFYDKVKKEKDQITVYAVDN